MNTTPGTTNLPHVELSFTETMRAAVEHAFAEAQAALTSAHEIRPFVTFNNGGGYEVVALAGTTVDEVYAAARELVARRAPDFYVLTYDGFIETPAGVQDAVTCEVAPAGAARAQVLALPYTVADAVYTFCGTYGSAGTADQLYPAAGSSDDAGAAEEDADAACSTDAPAAEKDAPASADATA